MDTVFVDNDRTSEMLAKLPTQKRNRAMATVSGISDEESVPAKRDRLNDAINIINLDNLPEKRDKNELTKNRTAPHDKLYHLLKVEATQFLQRRVLKRQPGTSNNIHISNGKLSNITGPIRLIDKTPTTMDKIANAIHVARKIQSANAAIASLPKKDKARKLKESIQTQEVALNSLLQENHNDKHFTNVERKKRTYGGRTKPFNAPQFRFKVNTLTNDKRRINRHKMHHEENWKNFKKSLHANVNDAKLSFEQMAERPMEFIEPKEIEQFLSWNTSKTLGQLPNTQFIFQRNEFGMIEMDTLAMSKLQAMRSHKNDCKSFPKMEPSMACGHPDSATCFDAFIQRLIGSNVNQCKISFKKPHQYYSIEFKELFGALVQQKKNNCQAITELDIKKALHETSMFDRMKNASEFSWPRFVDYYNKKHAKNEQIQLAPIELFTNQFPTTPNTFEIGQKLEAIDPYNSSLFCVCTIVDKCGYRIKLHFDDYSASFDFWLNANSVNIFPAGWCSKTGRELELPRRIKNNRMPFDWKEYLRKTKTQSAHPACFANLNMALHKTQVNPFKIGMKLEADDRRNSRTICVASIGDVIDSRILVTLDDFDNTLNYWADIRSPYIHPIDFHKENGYSITSPPNWRLNPFSWESYLRSNRAESVPKDAFYTRDPIQFTVGMALEIIDKMNPSLIRPAIVTMVDEYEIKVLFIGWPEKYAYWVEDDSANIFPAGYCKKTGHPIECPLDDIYKAPINSCGILGCRGIGNGTHLDATIHTTYDDCPYNMNNWITEHAPIRSQRVERKHKLINKSFNLGAGPYRKFSVNPSLEKVQVSLKPILNPTEMAAMSSKDVEMFRRLQVSFKFLIGNRNLLTDLHQQWMDRVKSLKFIKCSAAAKNPLNWNKDEVAKFVSQLDDCEQLTSIFIEHEIDGLAFLSLRQNDMIDKMGLSLGAAIKISNRIMVLREECNAHYIQYE